MIVEPKKDNKYKKFENNCKFQQNLAKNQDTKNFFISLSKNHFIVSIDNPVSLFQLLSSFTVSKINKLGTIII